MASERLLRSKLPHDPTSSTQQDHLPVCRQFWKAGDYQTEATKNATGFRVHPKFLHSNATSHKWAFGALAELVDNAMDEVQNGATFVKLDKIINPRDNSPMLLVQDDGGGMNPNTMRDCMSLGFSRRSHKNKIGRYGNGFKTSTMRLGADVIVFSSSIQGSMVIQTVGLLSFTYLRKAMGEEVIVPMLDYEVSIESLRKRLGKGSEPTQKLRRTRNSSKYLESILEWSPYASERELLEQFEDIGVHGTKVIVYNLWLNDSNVLELDFDTDEHDIQLSKDNNQANNKSVKLQLAADQHISNRYQNSLRIYSSILYLKMPPRFQIILRGKPVEHFNLVAALEHHERVTYTPKSGSKKYRTMAIRVGFTKQARLINGHGFNVYHKNRLIMPFWKVFQESSSRGRGVMGVLEANFVEPAHDKQDFEKTSSLLKLKARLQVLTLDFWKKNSHKIGYQVPGTKTSRAQKRAAAPKANVVSKNLSGASKTPARAFQGSRPNTANADGPQVQSRSANEASQVEIEPVDVQLNSSTMARSADRGSPGQTRPTDIPQNSSKRTRFADDRVSQEETEPTDVPRKSFKRARPSDGDTRVETEPTDVPQKSSERSRSSNRAFQVETEPIHVPHNPSKRSGSANTTSEAEYHAHRNSSPARDAAGSPLLRETPLDYDDFVAGLMRENMELKQSRDPNKRDSKVLRLEQELRDAKEQNMKLVADVGARGSTALELEKELRDAKEQNLKLIADARARDSNVLELKNELREAKLTNTDLLEDVKARNSKVRRVTEMLQLAEKRKSDLEEQVRELQRSCSSKFNNEDFIFRRFSDHSESSL